MLELMTLFMVKHTVADYFMQYSWMIKDKGTYGAKGGLAHAGYHGFLTFLVLLTVPCATWSAIIGFAVADSIIHYHIDYAKSNIWKSKGYTSMDQMFWVTHGVDQLLHLLTYIGIIYLLCV